MDTDYEKMADGVFEAVRGFLTRSLAPILETQRGVIARLDKSAETIASLERRASRQSDHLAKLESRLQALEHGAKK